MITRALFGLLGFAVGIAETQSDEPRGSNGSGRVVEGQIVAAGSRPVEAAKVLFCQHEYGIRFVEEATATTDAQGRYRADLVKLPWSTDAIRALVLAPGYKVSDRKVEPGTGTALANFELVPEPWRETQVRLEDRSGRPVAGPAISTAPAGEFEAGRVLAPTDFRYPEWDVRRQRYRPGWCTVVQRPVTAGSLPQLNAHAAGIDVGGTSHFVAVPADRDAASVREFASFTGDLYRLAEWLTACGPSGTSPPPEVTDPPTCRLRRWASVTRAALR